MAFPFHGSRLLLPFARLVSLAEGQCLKASARIGLLARMERQLPSDSL